MHWPQTITVSVQPPASANGNGHDQHHSSRGSNGHMRRGSAGGSGGAADAAADAADAEADDVDVPLLSEPKLPLGAETASAGAASDTASVSSSGSSGSGSKSKANDKANDKSADSVFFDQSVYLLTGIATTLLGQQLNYMGAANKYSLIPVALVYLGMASVWFLPDSAADKAAAAAAAAAAAQQPKSAHAAAAKPTNRLSQFLASLDPRLTFLVVALGDCVGNAICFIAMVMAGSGLFQVIYSSILIFVAIQSRVLLGKPISRGAWLWIGVVSAGLLIAGVAPFLAAGSGSSSGSSGGGAALPSASAIGMCVLGVLVYSFQYIIYECAMTLPTLRVTSKQLCVQVGLYGSALTLAYITLYTVPNYTTLLAEPMAAAAAAGAGNGSGSGVVDGRTILVVVALYVLILLCHSAHNVTYFNLVGSPTGAMGAGLLQAVRAVGVFGLSHAFFCSVSPSQCFDAWKGASTAVVVAGVLGYSKYK